MWPRSIKCSRSMLLLRSSKLSAFNLNAITDFALYHSTGNVLFPVDSKVKPTFRRRRNVLSSSGVHAKPFEWEDRGQVRPPSTSRKDERSGMQSPGGHGGNYRLSSDLSKLSMEDFSDKWERPRRKISASDPKEEDYEIVFGVSPCHLALRQGRRKLRKLFIKDGETSSRTSVLAVCETAHRQGVPIQRVGKRALDKMASGHVHQGVCLEASPLNFIQEGRNLPPNGQGSTCPLWLVLECIQDPMNLGAILRSAYFLGVDRVASSLDHSCPLSPVVSKASSGAMEILSVYGYKNLEDMVKRKAAQGWQVVGTVGAKENKLQIPVAHFQVTKPTLVLIGGEAKGLSHELLSLCQSLLTIPAGRELYPGIDSLNVSVATGILLHSLLYSKQKPQ